LIIFLAREIKRIEERLPNLSRDSFIAKRANELWDTLYQLAKDKKLNILK